LNNGASPRSSGGPIVRVQDVWKSYDGGSIPVLNGVSFTVDAGESVALCGPSGCGKSTLLHLLGGLDEPERGQVIVNGFDPASRHDSLQVLRHEVGFVFQLHNLIPDLTLEENCLIPAVAAGTPHDAARARIEYLTTRTGLNRRLRHRIQKLSGGERQRTALCRALMNRPRILLADEPTGSLDERTSEDIFALLLEMVAMEGITLVMATHDRRIADRCHRLIEMHDGKINERALVSPLEAR
jgi:lipoprotein-releasing system ATP-binding protein